MTQWHRQGHRGTVAQTDKGTGAQETQIQPTEKKRTNNRLTTYQTASHENMLNTRALQQPFPSQHHCRTPSGT